MALVRDEEPSDATLLEALDDVARACNPVNITGERLWDYCQDLSDDPEKIARNLRAYAETRP